MTCQEAKEGIINLHEVDSTAMQAVFYFLYERPFTTAQEDGEKDILFHVRVYALADNYLIDELKGLVCQLFDAVLEQYWNDERLPQAILEGYNLAAPGENNSLVNSIRKTCAKHLPTLMKKPAFVATLQALPGLCSYLLKYSVAIINASKYNSTGQLHKVEIRSACGGCGVYIGEKYWSEHQFLREGSKTYTYHRMYCPAKCGALLDERDERPNKTFYQ